MRLSPAMSPFWPPVLVVCDISTLSVIHDSSPWVEMTSSPASRVTSRTGRVVPFTSACMAPSSSQPRPRHRAQPMAASTPMAGVDDGPSGLGAHVGQHPVDPLEHGALVGQAEAQRASREPRRRPVAGRGPLLVSLEELLVGVALLLEDDAQA